MAIFPQGLTQIERSCRGNAGERRVFHQLKRCLSDDHLVWHNVPIGPRARQPDFVILSPRQGVLLLEVKHWKARTLAEASRDTVTLDLPRGRITESNPLRQARDYCMELVGLMQQDAALVHGAGPFAGKLLFPYGWGVVFSNIREAEVADTEFFDLFPHERVLMAEDLDEAVNPADLTLRLWGMFTVSYPHLLSPAQRDRIRWHLFPEIRINPPQLGLTLDDDTSGGDAARADGGAATAGEAGGPRAVGARPLVPVLTELDMLHVMDLQQEQLARSLGEGHRIIHGTAGSGKTMILIFRAHQLAAAARPEQPVLVLCYNRQLASHIAAQLRQRGADERVQVRTFHAWCIEMARQHRLPVPTLGLQAEDYPKVVAAVAEALHTSRIPQGQYTAVLLDEAHDFEDDWLRMATQLVSPSTQSLLVLYDDAQSIYQKQRRRFNFASVGIQARGRSSILDINYRNTAEVLALSMHCAQRLLQQDGELRLPVHAEAGADAGATGSAAGCHPAGAGASIRAAGAPVRYAELDGGDANPLHAAETPLLNGWVRPSSAGRHGPPPVLIEARSSAEEAELVAERILSAVAQGRGWSDVLILYRAHYLAEQVEQALTQRDIPVQSMRSGRKSFDWERPSVKLMTMHSAKGLECPLVFIVGLQGLPARVDTFDEAMRLLYVAMTRATHELVLSACGRSAVVEQVRHSLAEVAGA